jgi:hypothetical protein
MKFNRETVVNISLALLLLAIPLVALQLNSPFYVTLATRMAILALAAVGLNLALGLGGVAGFAAVQDRLKSGEVTGADSLSSSDVLEQLRQQGFEVT